MTDPTGQIPAHVDVISVRLTFGDRKVFDGLSCRFPQGRISVILGASGIGKSCLLKLIACLMRPQYGDIWIGDDEITCMHEREARRMRHKLGMMFQGGALLDSMTVFDNVALQLREHRVCAESEISDRIAHQFDAVGLKNVNQLLPGELSGGMKKRVALARAMITEPEILLVDEPFSGLDPPTVRLIERLLAEVNERTGITMIMTNHHIGSTFRIADEIAFLADGASICGTPDQLQKSIDPRIRNFLDAAASPEPQMESD